MKNIILFILFIVGIFILNICFYYGSEDYRNFLKRVKNESEKTVVKDDFTKINDSNYFSGVIEEKETEAKIIEEPKTENKDIEVKEEVKLWKWYQNILNIFSEYDLTKRDVTANLFDVTNEYPDQYFEYYSQKLTLYFFTSKTYNQVYDIFDVLQKELPFTINQSNNFWDNSFYINLEKDINDSIVRMVISIDWIVFWLKVHTSEYENIKQKLENLKNN